MSCFDLLFLLVTYILSKEVDQSFFLFFLVLNKPETKWLVLRVILALFVIIINQRICDSQDNNDNYEKLDDGKNYLVVVPFPKNFMRPPSIMSQNIRGT